VPRITSSFDRLVTRQELASLMRVSVPTIDRMRREGMPCVTWGRRLVRFRVGEAIAWAEQQQFRGVVDGAPGGSRPPGAISQSTHGYLTRSTESDI
jgi:hypothetical protein